MARGNQRDKAREKNMKEQAGKKKGNQQTGSELAKAKEDAAAIMRAKQAAGELFPPELRHGSGGDEWKC
ncbi:4F5 domain protein [Melanomma pulvis-pyrius CBS 109.77]|uniref:4F5 domain protein n=1 Tax=Melanomma pulvis-pyrius CBS 109.77 TaxID=1314802 RepID=A0A6A6XDL3_9PLEO|nr:4F5 domain protein [Melanomma pulvis-pyrius CBS 109.77]